MKRRCFTFSWVAILIWTTLWALIGFLSFMHSMQGVSEASNSDASTSAISLMIYTCGITTATWFLGFVGLGILTLFLNPNQADELGPAAPFLQRKRVAMRLLGAVILLTASMSLVYAIYPPWHDFLNEFVMLAAALFKNWYWETRLILEPLTDAIK